MAAVYQPNEPAAAADTLATAAVVDGVTAVAAAAAEGDVKPPLACAPPPALEAAPPPPLEAAPPPAREAAPPPAREAAPPPALEAAPPPAEARVLDTRETTKCQQTSKRQERGMDVSVVVAGKRSRKPSVRLSY
jgi:hypothetical protein